ncbi:complement component 1 Q subcomponent-binding protein, mitochondrial isoform X2 [Sitodiplosis mosellana]|uniref:complement component 1 Q subcomponent-binding protein, mitochondrial isoform X2 n=1 Tax=Sitodiplosis mosellana TaxID=263140 RepID=UPI0024442C2D|nr:complement component 1 Q subcomponent-binding protein, mitochondrial isoform X2 [Sitodiplosis mosellana]
MSQILRSLARSGAFKSIVSPIQQSSGLRAVGARSLWHMSKPSVVSTKHRCTGFAGCQCGCGKRFTSTNGEKALIEFLQEEIETEKSSLAGHLPSQLDGFQIKFDAAEVELTKTGANETVIVKFNVNHTVDESDEDWEVDNQQQAQQEPPKLHSKPNFEVDIVKKDTTLSLSCTFLTEKAQEDDVYGIEELTIFKGKHSEKVYACAGDMLDGYFYDLLMNLLSEKGVTDEFVRKMQELATQYEQSLFVDLLQETKQFFESK